MGLNNVIESGESENRVSRAQESVVYAIANVVPEKLSECIKTGQNLYQTMQFNELSKNMQIIFFLLKLSSFDDFSTFSISTPHKMKKVIVFFFTDYYNSVY